ncbi:MAG: hypothetical protein ACYC2T_13930 [Bacillota bacterium]
MNQIHGYRKVLILVGLLIVAAILFTGCPRTNEKPGDIDTQQPGTQQPDQNATNVSEKMIKDNAPEGCEGCHKKVDEATDRRISQAVKNIEGHPPVAEDATIQNCTPCHIGENPVGPPFRKAMHKVHLITGEKYKENYDHNCINCHKIADDGTVTVKALSQ